MYQNYHNIPYNQWCSQGQSLKAKALALMAKAKLIGLEATANAFKHTARAEIKTWISKKAHQKQSKFS